MKRVAVFLTIFVLCSLSVPAQVAVTGGKIYLKFSSGVPDVPGNPAVNFLRLRTDGWEAFHQTFDTQQPEVLPTIFRGGGRSDGFTWTYNTSTPVIGYLD